MDIAPADNGAFASVQNFEDAQRMAKLLAASNMVPDNYRSNLGDCVIALEMSRRIGANVLAVMQNLYIVHGKPAWSSQFLIACVNASRRFSPLRYRTTGTKGQPDWGCVAWATDRSGEVLESPEVTIAMATAEGWVTKNGSKWKTMPELMLRYRAATLFARTYAPELTMGIHTDDEVIDVASLPVANTAPVVTESAKALFDAPAAAPAAPVAEAAAPKRPRAKAAPAPEPVPEPAPAEVVPTVPAPVAAPTPTPAPAPAPVEKVETHAEALGALLADNGVAFDDFHTWLSTTGRASEDQVMNMDSYGTVPESLARELLADAKGLRRCVTLYGKKA